MMSATRAVLCCAPADTISIAEVTVMHSKNRSRIFISCPLYRYEQRSPHLFAAGCPAGPWHSQDQSALRCGHSVLSNAPHSPIFASDFNIVGAFAGCVQQELPASTPDSEVCKLRVRDTGATAQLAVLRFPAQRCFLKIAAVGISRSCRKHWSRSGRDASYAGASQNRTRQHREISRDLAAC